jgi:hypothetical protein
MKCPKCSFISFDYNEVCPKCRNDLSHERALMNFPSYKPKPLSLLGVSTGDGEIPAVDTLMGQSEVSGAPGEGAEELLISLNSLSDEDQEPILFETEPSLTASEIKTEGEAAGADEELTISLDDLSGEDQEPILFEPQPSLTGPETKIEKGAGAADEEFTISLDDLSGEAPELVLFDPETKAAMPEVEIGDEVVFEPETFLYEDAGPEKEGFWESEAIEQRMADMQLDDSSEKERVISDNAEELTGKGKETELDLFELGLETLELDVEMEGPDKKTP